MAFCYCTEEGWPLFRHHPTLPQLVYPHSNKRESTCSMYLEVEQFLFPQAKLVAQLAVLLFRLRERVAQLPPPPSPHALTYIFHPVSRWAGNGRVDGRGGNHVGD